MVVGRGAMDQITLVTPVTLDLSVRDRISDPKYRWQLRA